MNYLMVAAGGMFGALARYLVMELVARINQSAFPFGTFAVNIAGSLLLGFLGSLLLDKLSLEPYWRVLITTGFLGAFTTFSTLEFETLKLWQEGLVNYALLNAMGSMLTGFVAVWLGYSAAKLV